MMTYHVAILTSFSNLPITKGRPEGWPTTNGSQSQAPPPSADDYSSASHTGTTLELQREKEKKKDGSTGIRDCVSCWIKRHHLIVIPSTCSWASEVVPSSSISLLSFFVWTSADVSFVWVVFRGRFGVPLGVSKFNEFGPCWGVGGVTATAGGPSGVAGYETRTWIRMGVVNVACSLHGHSPLSARPGGWQGEVGNRGKGEGGTQVTGTMLGCQTVLPILTTSLVHFSLKGRENVKYWKNSPLGNWSKALIKFHKYCLSV